MELRVTANLIWDVTADSFEEGRQKAAQFLDEIIAEHPVRRSVSISEVVRKKQQRLAVFRPDEVLPHVVKSGGRRTFKVGEAEYQVKMNSDRYHLFTRNLQCVSCGLVGSFMALELAPNSLHPHFNLYALEGGCEVLMTKDHVKPVAKGGPDRDENYQTMCAICNNIKGDGDLTVEQVKELREVYNVNIHKVPPTQLAAIMREEKSKRLPDATTTCSDDSAACCLSSKEVAETTSGS